MKLTLSTHLRYSVAAFLLPILLGALGSSAYALDEFKDWDIACDNTRHCEAVGTETEAVFDDNTYPPVALWIARDAGPNTPIRGKLTLIYPDGQATGPVTVDVGDKHFPIRVAEDGGIDSVALKPLLAAMLNANEAKILAGGRTWLLSLAGFKAAALKMDDVQGRLQTPGALVRKGNKSEASVPAPLPAPVVHAVPFMPDRQGDAALIAPILAAVADRECFENLPDDHQPEVSVFRISATQVIVERECSRAAYQSEPTLWLANDKPPYSPTEVEFDDAAMNKTNGAGQYNFELDPKTGLADSMMMGRGLNDCNDTEEWAWTGRRFVMTGAGTAPQCRGIPGGVTLRVWVSK